MQKYLLGLISQFAVANKIKNIDLNSSEFMDEFNDWLRLLNKQGNDYAALLENMNFDFKSSACAEVGKSKYDSVVIPFDTTIITPTCAQFDETKDSNIIIGNMKVYECNPFLVRSTSIGNYLVKIPDENINMFMTQNPINETYIHNWENLHNSKNANIIVGAYGCVSDFDKEKKLEYLKSLRSKLNGDYCDEYVTNNDTYMCVIGSNNEEKKLINALKK